MELEFTKFVSAISRATDFVEEEILHVPRYHEKRVAVLSYHMGRSLGFDEDTLFGLTLAAALHDCALHEALPDDYSQPGYQDREINMADHCIAGEDICLQFPFYEKVRGAVLCHHERADGQGALGKKAEETPLAGQLLHIADSADRHFSLDSMDPVKYDRLMSWMDSQKGIMFSEECLRIFQDSINEDILYSISGDQVVETLHRLLPDVKTDVSMDVMRKLATFFAHITDYKSHFTWKHSLGIAEKAERIGSYYGYSQEMCDKLFIAGALHDIGKLLISNDILEKPGRLTPTEYVEIQNHALGTWELLHDIGGMEDITSWAALHHEKLDGSGYPFGYTADQLGRHERLLACLDIYQALSEERPYKAAMSHEDSMKILRKMGANGQLDEDIINDIDQCHDEHMTTGICTSRTLTPVRREGYAGEAWICPVCGYVYEGSLPDDFICPLCEQPGKIFEKISYD